jgi:hypothetical protein
MTDIYATLKTCLETTGVPVYFELLPVNGMDWTLHPSYIRFQRISTHEFVSHSGRSNLHRDRFQVTCVGRTHADLVTCVGLMEIALYLNQTDVQLAYPLEGSREFNDGANTYSKDFYVFYVP